MRVCLRCTAEASFIVPYLVLTFLFSNPATFTPHVTLAADKTAIHYLDQNLSTLYVTRTCSDTRAGAKIPVV